MIKNPLRKILYYSHIWIGLLTSSFFIVYLFSGVFLNHRGFFNNMERWENETITFDPQERAAAQEFMEARDEFAAAMAKHHTWKYDDISIGPDGRASFISKRGGMSTLHVPSSGGTGVISTAYKRQPWYFMNQQEHKNLQMLPAWAALSTTLCVLTFVVLLSGLLILPWKRLDLILLLAGIALILIGVVVAQMPYESAAIMILSSPTPGLYC